MKKFDISRIRLLNNVPLSQGPVVYWMSRDQRVEDNWALLYAQQLAREQNEPLVVVFSLTKNFLDATDRIYAFMLHGLQEINDNLTTLNIPFCLLEGSPEKTINDFCKSINAGALVTDFSPLKISHKWKSIIAKTINIQLIEVDSHNIVPAWVVSQKQEFGAYTLRPKLYKLLPNYLTNFPTITKQTHKWSYPLPVNKFAQFTTDKVIKSSGSKAASHRLREFIDKTLSHYSLKRNDPNENVSSRLSAHLHFGQISAQRIALEISKSNFRNDENLESFLDELIVRRELADNFCLYNTNYDSFEGFPRWSQETLNLHRKDKREYEYSYTLLENAETHDALWNASQNQMLKTGYMHGYMRMYWAKKILEWTKSPEEAMAFAIKLNDTYELDGRDPNGYAGIAWGIGGVHDRAWFELPIFGKVRYMNANGAKRKFNVDLYIQTWLKNK